MDMVLLLLPLYSDAVSSTDYLFQIGFVIITTFLLELVK